MASITTVSNLFTRTALAAALALAEAGSGPALINFYSLTQPTNPDVAITSQVKLGTLTMSDPAYATPIDANPGGRAIANAITPDSSADATGTASWIRKTDSNGLAFMDGNVGTNDESCLVNTTSFVAGAEIDVPNDQVNFPET